MHTFTNMIQQEKDLLTLDAKSVNLEIASTSFSFESLVQICILHNTLIYTFFKFYMISVFVVDFECQ
jgi:hypothetical protein